MCTISVGKGDGSIEIAEMIPPASAVTVVAENREVAGEYMRRLRRKGLIARFASATDDENEISKTDTGDDVRLIVGLGGEKEIDCAKRLGYIRKLPVYAVLNSPDGATAFSSRCPLEKSGLVLPFACAVPVGAAVADDLVLNDSLPSAFGAVCAAAVGLTDSEAYLRAVGKAFDCSVRDKAYEYVYSVMDAAAKRGRSCPALGAEVARLSLGLSLECHKAGLSFVRGAADDCARAMRMLCIREERTVLARGELAFVFASSLCEVYRELCETDLSLSLPPDNNLRAEMLVEYLGFDEITAAKAAVGRLRNVNLAAYRVREYRDEIANAATDAVKVFDDAKKTFRRLHSDDGYSVSASVEPCDVKLCIALAPDTFAAAGSALVLMREFGLLERFLF